MVEFAYNNAVNASTKFTPFFLNYGRHPLVPLHLKTGLPNVSEPEAAESILKKLYEGYVLARAHLEEAQEKMAGQVNRHRREHTYHVGDEVWLQSKHIKYGPNKRTALDAKWIGPTVYAD